MENEIMETLQVYKHPQHARIQKEEEEELWISSEDLRTDGSSDEEVSSKTHVSNRNKLLKRNDALSYLSKKSKSKSPNQSRLMKSTSDQSAGNKSTSSELYTPSTSKSNTNTENLPCINVHEATSEEKDDERCGASASSDIDVEALNLESRWRPKRGSLKLPNLIEGQTTENYMHEINSFYNEMKITLQSLQRDESWKRNYSKMYADNSEKLFKNLKYTPQVQASLEIIKKLDEDIKETIASYKVERAERLKAQEEMCNAIIKDEKVLDRQSQLFLELCNFEGENVEYIEETTENRSNDNCIPKNTKRSQIQDRKDFIKRNFLLAKEGVMANYSLTDEEKQQLEGILKELEDNDLTNEDLIKGDINESSSFEDCNIEMNAENISRNAYIVQNEDRERLEEINKALEEYTESKSHCQVSKRINIREESFWNQCLLEEALKDIDKKLEEIFLEDDKEKVRIEGLKRAAEEDEDGTERTETLTENEFKCSESL